MSDLAKQILIDINQPLSGRMKDQFVSYLQDINQNNLIEPAKKIDWTTLTQLFELEYAKLWGRMSVPKILEGFEILKKEYEILVLDNLKQKLFNLIHKYLMNQLKENKLSDENKDGIISDIYNLGIYDFFKIFDYQFTLSSLSKNPDIKIINKKIEELRKRTKSGAKILAKKQSPEEDKIFKKIDDELERRERINQKWSIRALCDYYGRNELGYGQDPVNRTELDRFYERYLEYHNKMNPI